MIGFGTFLKFISTRFPEYAGEGRRRFHRNSRYLQEEDVSPSIFWHSCMRRVCESASLRTLLPLAMRYVDNDQLRFS